MFYVLCFVVFSCLVYWWFLFYLISTNPSPALVPGYETKVQLRTPDFELRKQRTWVTNTRMGKE